MPEPSKPDPISVSVSEAAALVGVSRASLYPFLMSGELGSLKIGTRRLVLVSALREWAERQADFRLAGEHA